MIPKDPTRRSDTPLYNTRYETEESPHPSGAWSNESQLPWKQIGEVSVPRRGEQSHERVCVCLWVCVRGEEGWSKETAPRPEGGQALTRGRKKRKEKQRGRTFHTEIQFLGPPWPSNTLATWCKELTHWKRSWCRERLKAGGEGTTEDEMVGWHHRLNGHEFEQALGVGDGQGSLVCCSPWGCKELDMTEWTTTNHPGGPAVKTLHFHRGGEGGEGSISGWGTKIPYAAQCGQNVKRIRERAVYAKVPGARKWPTGEAEICPHCWVPGGRTTRGDGAEKQAEVRHAACR